MSSMSSLGAAHTLIALLAMVLGGVVVVNRKGTRRHKALGWGYVASMVLLNATALSIYRLFGKFGPFHWLALSSLISIFVALTFMLLKRPRNWLALHGETMSWSYVGLLAAAVAEISVRVLHYPFGLTVAISSLLVIAIGGTITRMTMARWVGGA
jgi:uncharacterized membrane protein